MTIRALYSAASGMNALQFKLDTTANNLANAGTTAFKRSRTNFEDVFYQHFKLPGLRDNQGQLTPTGISLGLGTRVSSTQVDMTQGSLLSTGQPLDLAIVGEGFFQVQDGNQFLYTRAGNFTVNDNGDLVIASADRGRLLEPNINIPQDALNISVSEDGFINYQQPNQTNITQLGPIQLVRFINPQGLLALGENLYQQTDASGQPNVSTPGLNGVGTIRGGFLEASNVEPIRELVDLITTQRNFELNSQVVQAADQALQVVNNLRRY
jgi:flagellar basal-body rod protein FlgG